MAEDTKKPEEQKPAEGPVASKKKEPAAPKKAETKPAVMHVEVRRTGLEESDGSGRYVRVLQTSYVNGAVHEKGAVVPWPKGVDKLGPNLEEYTG